MADSNPVSTIFNDLRRFQKKYSGQVVIFKFGGTLAENDDVIRRIGEQAAFLAHNIEARVMVVHGGGKQIDDALAAKKIETKKDPLSGRRITDAPTLEVSDVALRALNGRIVRLFNEVANTKVRAVGMAGYDARAIDARPINAFTGQATDVDTDYFSHLMNFGRSEVIPVIYPICHHSAAKGDETRLNVNADDVAAMLAARMGARRLILCSDIPGVLDREKNLIQRISTEEIDGLIENGTVTGGMIAKVRAAAEAAETMRDGGVVILDGRQSDAILTELLYQEGMGTLIQQPGAEPPVLEIRPS